MDHVKSDRHVWACSTCFARFQGQFILINSCHIKTILLKKREVTALTQPKSKALPGFTCITRAGWTGFGPGISWGIILCFTINSKYHSTSSVAASARCQACSLSPWDYQPPIQGARRETSPSSVNSINLRVPFKTVILSPDSHCFAERLQAWSVYIPQACVYRQQIFPFTSSSYRWLAQLSSRAMSRFVHVA